MLAFPSSNQYVARMMVTCRCVGERVGSAWPLMAVTLNRPSTCAAAGTATSAASSRNAAMKQECMMGLVGRIG